MFDSQKPASKTIKSVTSKQLTTIKQHKFPSINGQCLGTHLTLNIPSLARQRCLSSWGPRRTPWFFCNFSTVWCSRLLKLCFLGFWNYDTVIQALLASNILCLFISTEVSQQNPYILLHKSVYIFTYDFVQYVHVKLII